MSARAGLSNCGIEVSSVGGGGPAGARKRCTPPRRPAPCGVDVDIQRQRRIGRRNRAAWGVDRRSGHLLYARRSAAPAQRSRWAVPSSGGDELDHRGDERVTAVARVARAAALDELLEPLGDDPRAAMAAALKG